MKWLRDLPIKRKLTLAILLTCSVVLLLACGILAVYQMLDFRRTVVRNSTVLADVLAKNTQAALAFQDENAAQKTLLALQAEPDVSAACLYAASGNQLANYIRPGTKIVFPKKPSADGHHFDHGRLLLFRPVMLDDKPIGTLYLQTDLRGMYNRLWVFAGIALLVLLGSVLVAFALSSRLQRPVSGPILALAETARIIADHKDYSVRAKSHGRDETGLLTDAFNQMLAGIQERENALRAANEALRSEIAERQRAEDAITRFAAIVESSDDAVISETLDGIITSWNPSAERIFGYSITEIVGRPTQILTPPKYAHEESEILARITNGEHIRHFETVRVRKDGRQIDVSITISPINDATGKIVGTSKIARDITERKQLESQLRQSQKMEAIGQLAGGVAHDFNNILAVIQMQSDLLKIGGHLSPAQMDFADEIGVAVERAAALIRQLLMFSRKETLQLRDLDLSQTITNMTKMLQRILREDIRMEFKFAPQPLFIHADASMMDQVLMNLAVNARDAMPKGGLLVIETSAVDFDDFAAAQTPKAQPGSYVCLSVSDTGCGIAPEILPRIFEPFFTTKDVGKGTGLGLATIFGIVQQHQGWINVYSEVGHGTTFRVYLPRLEAAAIQKSARQNSTPMHAGNETILIVEDDKSLRASVQKALSQQGYQVLEASTAMNALEIWNKNRDEIRLVLTDLVMPGGMSGRELARRLLRENSGLKIIYTSGYSSEVIGKDFPLHEGVNFLTKPFQAAQLAKTIRACLDA